eukprot:1133806-Pelagomonas_calceolata.AAC.1
MGRINGAASTSRASTSISSVQAPPPLVLTIAQKMRLLSFLKTLALHYRLKMCFPTLSTIIVCKRKHMLLNKHVVYHPLKHGNM